jgi:mercuric ion binding protein
MKKLAIAVTLAVALGAPAYAAMKTVTLLVSGMTCAACPITVKKALGKVEGVGAIEVSYEKKEAVVTYDDTKTNVEALTKATEGAGYPSAPKN